jgi:hypothetical protein
MRCTNILSKGGTHEPTYEGKKNKLQPGKSLKSYLRPQETGKKKQRPITDPNDDHYLQVVVEKLFGLVRSRLITIYKSWLKSYLDWFDPDLFQYIVSHTDGVQVTRFAVFWSSMTLTLTLARTARRKICALAGKVGFSQL